MPCLSRRHLSLLVLLAWAAFGPLGAGAQSTAPAAVRGNLYDSPTYGHTLVWDAAVWTVDDVSSANGHDTIQLSNGPTVASLDAYELPGGDTRACVTDAVASLKALAGTSDFRFLFDASIVEESNLYDADGNLIAVESVLGSGWWYASFLVAYDDGSGQARDFVWYVGCESLIAGSAVLASYDVTPADLYDDDVANTVDNLMYSVAIPGETRTGSHAAAADRSGAPVLGVLAFSARYVDDDLYDPTADDPALRYLVLEVSVTNVDTLASEIDLGAVLIDDLAPVGYQWTDGPAEDAPPQLAIAAGDAYTAWLYYLFPWSKGDDRPNGASYLDHGEPVDVGCIWSCGAGGGRPRIRTRG